MVDMLLALARMLVGELPRRCLATMSICEPVCVPTPLQVTDRLSGSLGLFVKTPLDTPSEKPTTGRYVPEEKAAAVRMARACLSSRHRAPDEQVNRELRRANYWAADALSELGATVHLAHPLGVKAFSAATR